MYKLPIKEKWQQSNGSDRFGSLSRTRNISLDMPGELSLAKRVRSIYDDSLDSDFGTPTSIAYYNTGDLYFVVTNEKLFTVVGSTLVTAEETTSGVPTLTSESDLCAWQGRMYVSASNTVKYFASSSWTDASISTTGGVLCLFKNKNNLAIGQGNTVKLYSTAHALTQTLTLPTEYNVTSMDWNNNFLYIGTRHQTNGEAILFVWDGATSAANYGFGVGASRVDSVTRYKNTVALVTSLGQLLEFSGDGFKELDNFPVYYTNYDWDGPGSGDNTSGRVIHRGMIAEGELIFIRVSGLLNISTDDDVGPNHLNSFPSGVWVYDPDNKLHHRYAQSGDLRLKSNAVATTDINATTNVITIGGQTVPASGTPVMYDDANDGVGTGIIADGATIPFRQRLYVIYVSDTTMKLASTYANAIAGTAMDITGTGNSSQYFIFLPNRGFGGVRNTTAGAVCLYTKRTGAGAPATDATRIIFGGLAAKNTVTTVPTLCVAADGQENRGDFITPKLFAAGNVDTFQNISIRFKGIKTPEDKILVKMRTIERYDFLKFNDANNSKTGTWTDANTFTSTEPRLSAAQVGDEVEIGRGAGSGYLPHISSISYSAPTYTINLDEDVQNVVATDTMLFYVDNWQRVGSITSSDAETFKDANGTSRSGTGGIKSFPLDLASTWVQFKIELRGEDVTIEDILVNNKPLSSFTS